MNTNSKCVLLNLPFCFDLFRAQIKLYLADNTRKVNYAHFDSKKYKQPHSHRIYLIIYPNSHSIIKKTKNKKLWPIILSI